MFRTRSCPSTPTLINFIMKSGSRAVRPTFTFLISFGIKENSLGSIDRSPLFLPLASASSSSLMFPVTNPSFLNSIYSNFVELTGTNLKFTRGSNYMSAAGLVAWISNLYDSFESSQPISITSWKSPSASVSNETLSLMARPAAIGPCAS